MAAEEAAESPMEEGPSRFDSSEESEIRPVDSTEKKKKFMTKLRRRLKLELPVDQDPSFDTSAYERQHWLQKGLSMRRPSAPLTSEETVVGVGTTRRTLPDHLLQDDFDVPEYQVDKLDDFKKVGSGSQALVYSTHALDGTKMAVKVLRAQLAADPVEFESFQREVNLLARLTHPNINNVIGIGRYQNLPCAVLEWCDSDVSRALRLKDVDMSNKLRRDVKLSLPARDRFKLCMQLADALKFLHSGSALPKCFVMHRDLKPDNLGLADGGNLKLLDFGLAVCLSSDDERASEAAVQSTVISTGLLTRMDSTLQRRTKAYDMVYDMTAETGTRRYMAPEVGKGLPYGLRADVYSFAIVAWEILAVSKPFVGFGARDMESRVWGAPQIRVTVPKSWHPKLNLLFLAMWHADPMERPNFEHVSMTLKDIYNSTTDANDPLGEHLESNGVCC